MSDQLLPFLDGLGLGRDADERAVRRAYAQRLKRVDQAADPQGFQALRSDYENALRWVAWQAQRQGAQDAAEKADHGVDLVGGGEPGATAASAHPAYEAPRSAPLAPTSAQSAADQVFAEFLNPANAGFRSEASALQALEGVLSDERLINLEARTLFERRTAALLMSGWRPGHEFLFGPACDLFNWERDRGRLELFGPLGQAVDAAIEQRLVFFRQAPSKFERQRQVVVRLRDLSAPSPETLRRNVPTMEELMQRYPQWLHVVTARENALYWRRLYDELPPGDKALSSSDDEDRLSRLGFWRKTETALLWLGALVVAVVIWVLFGSGESQHRSEPPPPVVKRPPMPGATASPPFESTGPVSVARWKPNPVPLPSFQAQCAADDSRAKQLPLLKRRQREAKAEMRTAVGEIRRTVVLQPTDSSVPMLRGSAWAAAAPPPLLAELEVRSVAVARCRRVPAAPEPIFENVILACLDLHL